MKKIMKYAAISAAIAGIVIVGTKVLKRIVDDDLPVFNEDDWV